MDTVDGVAGVQARIREILARFGAEPAGRVPGAGASAPDFAAALTDARQPARTGASNAAGVDPVRWARDFLTRLGMPVTAENVRAVEAWEQAEGTRARFNPLATTQAHAGASRFNSVGVKSYATYDDGLDANVTAITNGLYANILAALRRGTSAEAVARAIADSPWGTGDLVLRLLRSRQGV